MLPEVPLVDSAPGPGDAGLAAALAARIPADRISIDEEDRVALARDQWSLGLLWLQQGRMPAPPSLVCRPRSTEEVAEVVRFAGERGVPVVPHGGGSGVCGGAIHLRGGIALDLRGMDRLRQVDPASRTIEVEAGMGGWDLEQRLGARGLALGHLPSSIAMSTVGGWVATRGAGQTSSRHGKIEDQVLGLEVVLGTGEILRLDRPCTGSDLLELFLGSEGTLGVITAVRLRVFDAPRLRQLRAFRFPSLSRGLEAMEAIFHAGLRPAVARLHDPLDTRMAFGGEEIPGTGAPPPRRSDLRIAQERPSFDRRRPGASWRWLRTGLRLPLPLQLATGTLRACQLVLVHEGDGAEVRGEAAEVRAICQRLEGIDRGAVPALRWMRRRWDVARKLPPIFDAGAWVDTCEVAADWGRLESVHRAVRRAASPHALVMAHFSHAWPDGCSIYFTFAGAGRQAERGYRATWQAALDAALAQGATTSHHHGWGLLKAPWLQAELGPGGMHLLQAARRTCDPHGILHPGRLP